MNNRELPLNKKNKPSIEPTFPSLPDDLLLSCLARVSKMYYPTLSLVSKRFRSLLASLDLYKTRSLLDRTEICLYVCLQSPPHDFKTRWFTLCRSTQTLTNGTSTEKSSRNILVPISVSHSPPVHWSYLVAFGSNIYNIGGPCNKEPSSSISILDCRSNTWHDAQNMPVERMYASASVLDGKIYVAGGCKDPLNSIEVFDSKTQIWEPVPSPNWGIYWNCPSQSACIEGKLYLMIMGQGLSYNPEEGKWDRVEQKMGPNVFWSSYCVIENVLYSYYGGELYWHDTKVRMWKTLKGLERLPKFPRSACVRLVDYGGKMAVLWHEYWPSIYYKGNTIWCAEIALKKRRGCEIWGNVEWCDGVLKVPNSYGLVNVLAVTV